MIMLKLGTVFYPIQTDYSVVIFDKRTSNEDKQITSAALNTSTKNKQKNKQTTTTTNKQINHHKLAFGLSLIYLFPT